MEVPSQLKTFELFQKSESEILEIFICLSWQLAVKVRGSTYCYWDEKFRNQQWKCELWAHARWTTCTCQHHAASIREIWGTLDLIFTFPGMQVTTIGITFCLVLFYLHHPPFFSCLALIKNFGPSRSKHTTKLTNSILFSWLAWDHWHWEVIFYKCNQCNYKCNFVKNLKTHKNSLYKCIQCNYKCIILGSLRNHNFFTNATNVITNALLEGS